MEHLHQLARQAETGVSTVNSGRWYRRYLLTTRTGGIRGVVVETLSEMEKHTLPDAHVCYPGCLNICYICGKDVIGKRAPNLLTLAWRENRTEVLVAALGFLMLVLSVTARDTLGTWKYSHRPIVIHQAEEVK